MGNSLNAIKKFLSNKNTVTIIGVILGIAVLYLGYNYRVKQAVTPVSVPYAKVEIPPRTVITEDMIGYTQVPKSMLKSNPNMISSAAAVVGKSASYGTTIPQNSMFYRESIMDEKDMPDSAFADIPDGYTIYSLKVDLHSTYGNSIMPDNYIDLYFKAIDDTSKVMYGKLIESIKVLGVRDSQGQEVFETSSETRTPAELLFAVPDDMFLLLRKAEYIRTNSIEITPVPRNASYSANPGDTLVYSDYIRDFIISKTTTVPTNEDYVNDPNAPFTPNTPTNPTE